MIIIIIIIWVFLRSIVYHLMNVSIVYQIDPIFQICHSEFNYQLNIPSVPLLHCKLFTVPVASKSSSWGLNKGLKMHFLEIIHETTRHRTFIFDKKNHSEVLCRSCSNDAKNGQGPNLRDIRLHWCILEQLQTTYLL